MDALIAFIGVLVGALITWLMQERMFDRQRKWELDNQRRQWDRAQLEDIRRRVSQLATVGGTKTTLEMKLAGTGVTRSRDPEADRIIIEEKTKEWGEITETLTPEIAALEDEGLITTFSEWLEAFDNVSVAAKTGVYQRDIFPFPALINFNKHINRLIADTFKPKK